MSLPVRRGWFLGVPVPRFLLPKSDSTEFALDGKFHFDVALSAPLGGGHIVRYRGALTPDRQRKVAAPTSRTPSVAGLERGAADVALNMRTSNGTR